MLFETDKVIAINFFNYLNYTLKQNGCFENYNQLSSNKFIYK